eukprot:6200976-Pleurochrysis_carterae.AAC.2
MVCTAYDRERAESLWPPRRPSNRRSDHERGRPEHPRWWREATAGALRRHASGCACIWSPLKET